MARYDDPKILRAIAHPTRGRLLQELQATGPMRAADVAARLDIPANQASFHLRQLAKYGLVEEDPAAARDKRDRVWRLVDDTGINFSTEEMAAQPGGRAAYAVYARTALARGHELVERAYEVRSPASEKRGISESAVRLTGEEAEKLQEELMEVVERYRAAGRAAGEEPGRETYSVYQLIQPFPEGVPPPQE